MFILKLSTLEDMIDKIPIKIRIEHNDIHACSCEEKIRIKKIITNFSSKYPNYRKNTFELRQCFMSIR